MAKAALDAGTVVPAMAGWAELDLQRALHPTDRSVIGSTESARSLVLDLFGGAAHARDLFNACARLGSLMAEAGASPSLAAGAIDNAVRALADAGAAYDPSRIAAARASLIEGYVAAVRDGERIAGMVSWEYPSCAVHLEDGSVAIACGYPVDDGEALATWAARIAGRLVKERIRRASLSGPDVAKAEVESALALVGIEVFAMARADGPAKAASRSWLRLPWRK